MRSAPSVPVMPRISSLVGISTVESPTTVFYHDRAAV
jgi:hypothetical protein